MRMIFDVGHPAHIHLYRNSIKELLNKGHQVKIIARKREITYDLLDNYGFKYIKFPQISKSLKNPMGIVKGDRQLLNIAKEFKPDQFISSGSILSAHVSTLIDRPHICFADTVTTRFSLFYLTAYVSIAPFTQVFLTPTALDWIPIRNVRYHGYHELAYLHPNWFKPNPAVLDMADLSKDDKIIIVRFSSWDAMHDIDQSDIFRSMEERLKFIKTLEKYGKVILTSETPLSKSFEKYKLPIPPINLLDLLYYSNLYIGEGATLASEAGVLGIPWIWICGKESRGYLAEQENRYGLGFNINTYKEALNKSIEILDNYSSIKKKWQKRKKKFLTEKIDVTSFMVWFFENYPESYWIMRENPNYDTRFK